MTRLLLLFVTLFALVGPAAAQDAQNYVEGLISRTLSSEGRLIDIAGLDVGFDGDVEVDRIALQDSEGEWLVIEGVELDWSPLSLLRDQLEIDLVAAERVSILRTPFATPSADAAGEPGALVAARIEALRVGELFVAEALAGQDVTLTLNGSADLTRDPATVAASLNAERVDGVEGRLTAEIVFNQVTGEIDLDLDLEEAGDGALAALLPVTGTPRVDLALTANGNADNLDAALTLELDAARLVDGTADVSTQDGVRTITADLTANLAPLVPPTFAPLVEGDSTLDLVARLQNGVLTFDTASLQAATLQLNADGMLDLEGEGSDLTLAARFGNADGSPVSLPRASGGPVAIDGVTLDAALTGSLANPQWSLDFAGDELTVAGLSLADFSVDADGRGAAPSEDTPLAVTLAIEGAVDAAPRVGLPPALQGNVSLDTRFVATSLDRVSIERLDLTTGSLALDASGTVRPQSLGGDVTFALTGQSPDIGVPVVTALLEGDLAASGRLVRDTDTQTLLLSDVTLTSDAVSFTAQGQGNAQTIDIDAELALTDLAALDERLAGGITVELALEGARNAPELTVRGEGDDVVLDGRDLARLRLSADAVLNADAPTGDLSLTARLDGEPVDISARLDTDETGVRRLTDIDARIASATLQGELALPQEGSPTGTLALNAPNLADLAPLALTELAGSLSADITLSANESAAVALRGQDILAAGVTVGTVQADIAVADWQTAPTPSGSFTASNIAAGGLQIATLALQADAGEDGYSTALTANVNEIDVTANAVVAFEDDATRVTLAELTAAGQGVNARLAEPATLTLSPDTTRLSPAVLQVADGIVRAEGLLAPRFDLKADIEGVRLAGFADLAPNLDPRGAVNGNLALTGTPDAPQARFDLRVSEASVAPTLEAGVPPLTLSLIGALRGQTLNATTRLSDAAGRPFAIESEGLNVADIAASANISGPLDELEYTIQLDAASLEAGAVAASDLAVTLTGRGVTPTPRSPIDLRLGATASLSGAVPPLAEGPVTLDALVLMPDAQTVRLTRVALETAGVQLTATGEADLASSTLALRLDGDAASPETGIAALDGLLRGDVDLAGDVRADWSQGRYALDGLRIASPALDVTVDGEVDAETVDVTLTGGVEALRAVDERLGGGVRFSANLDGPRDAPSLKAELRGEAVTLNGTPLRGAALDVTASLGDPLTADIALTGDLGREPLSLTAAIRQEEQSLVLRDLNARVGDATATGDVTLPETGAPTGRIAFDIPRLQTVAPLLLTDASGSASGVIELTDRGGAADARVDAEARNLRVGDARIDRFDADLSVADYLGTPEPRGALTAQGVRVGQFAFTSLSLDAVPDGGTIALSLDARGDPVTLSAQASLTTGDTAVLRLASARGRAYGVPIALRGPGSISFGETVAIDNIALDLGGGTLAVDGTVSPTLDLNVSARAVPVSLANAFQPSLEARGAVSGTARVTGQGDDIAARFDLAGDGLSAAPLASAGFGPLDVAASGTFENQRLSYSANVAGSGLDLASSGTVSLAGPEPVLDIMLTGAASTDPLADRLARAGVRANADIRINVAVSGPASDPRITGGITTDGATIGDAEGRFILRDVNADIGLEGERVVVRRLTASVGPGTLSVTGSVGLDGDLPADLDIAIRNGRFADGTLIVATVDADLRVTGPLLATPTLAGDVRLVETRVTLNDLPGGSVDPIDVRHVNAPADVLEQAQRLGIDAAEGGGSASSGGGAAVFLDVTVATQAPISVRGRGLNADLGGSLRLLGPSSDVRAVGAFDLIRGRLDLLDRRLNFDSGRLQFTGDLNPFIDFAATAQVDAAAITLRVVGRATQPEIEVSSVPDLPEDEALARLLFGRSLSELSPLQIVRLAQGVRTLTGGGSSPLDQAAAALGFSNLDIGVDDEGNATVGIGAYVNDRTYVNVEQSSAGSSRVVIDLEITDEVKARGSFDSGGSTGLGVFFEREY